MRNPARTRTCAGCGMKSDKAQFIRISKDKDGNIGFNTGGRGAYLCKSEKCLNAAIKKRRIASILRGKVPEEIFGQILNLIGRDEN